MKIQYPTRSRFLATCEEAIRKDRSTLLNGELLSIRLPERGYSRDTEITITPDDNGGFHTTWNSKHPSRFSSRIRAAALALYKQGCFGTYRTIHHNGLLTIRQTGHAEEVLFKRVKKSQHSDGVRINVSFHEKFNPPNSDSFVAKGQSRPITIIFNNIKFSASYLHENPKGFDREMQSIRFSRELKDEFKKVFPDLTGYFSIKLGVSRDEFIFDVVDGNNQLELENFAKQYIRQTRSNLDTSTSDSNRRERLKSYDNSKQASKQQTRARLINHSDPVLKEDIKQLYRYKCQICGEQIKKVGWNEELGEEREFEFLTGDAHHVSPLEIDGLDTPSNIICVCPNCHRRLHTGEYTIEFNQNGPFCLNQLTGTPLKMTIDPDHTLINRTF